MSTYRWLQFGDSEAQILFCFDPNGTLLANLQRGTDLAADRGIIPKRYALKDGEFTLEAGGKKVESVAAFPESSGTPVVLRTAETPLRLRVFLGSESDPEEVEIDPSAPLHRAFLEAGVLSHQKKMLSDVLREHPWFPWHPDPIGLDKFTFTRRGGPRRNRSLNRRMTPWKLGLAESRPDIAVRPVIWFEWPPIWWHGPQYITWPPPFTGFLILIGAVALLLTFLTYHPERRVVFHSRIPGGVLIDGSYYALSSVQGRYEYSPKLSRGPHHVQGLLKLAPIRDTTISCSRWGFGHLSVDLEPPTESDSIQTTFMVRTGTLADGHDNSAFELFINRFSAGTSSSSEQAGEQHALSLPLALGTYELRAVALPSHEAMIRPSGGLQLLLKTSVLRDTSFTYVTLPGARSPGEHDATVELYQGH